VTRPLAQRANPASAGPVDPRRSGRSEPRARAGLRLHLVGVVEPERPDPAAAQVVGGRRHPRAPRRSRGCGRRAATPAPPLPCPGAGVASRSAPPPRSVRAMSVPPWGLRARAQPPRSKALPGRRLEPDHPVAVLLRAARHVLAAAPRRGAGPRGISPSAMRERAMRAFTQVTGQVWERTSRRADGTGCSCWPWVEAATALQAGQPGGCAGAPGAIGRSGPRRPRAAPRRRPARRPGGAGPLPPSAPPGESGQGPSTPAWAQVGTVPSAGGASKRQRRQPVLPGMTVRSWAV